jgi:hypothetical protein
MRIIEALIHASLTLLWVAFLLSVVFPVVIWVFLTMVHLIGIDV